MALALRRMLSLGLVVGFAAVAVGCGCSSCDETLAPFGGGPPVAARAPDFTLLDVNPASPTALQARSVRQELSVISAWYFGHST